MNIACVYEVNWPVPVFLFISLGIAAFGLVVCLSFRKYRKKSSLVTGIVFGMIGIFLTCVSSIDYMNVYQNLYLPYKNGTYQVCEGYVEQFHPMPDEEHDSESFVVNGVMFLYPEASGYGYSACRKDGGLITGNGQYVRIRYLKYSTYNVILRLDTAQQS